MEGNEATLQFNSMQLLEQVKRISELQNSGALEGVQDKERHLEHLQRQAEDIRMMLARLQSQPRRSPVPPPVPPVIISPEPMMTQQNTSEIYQNLGPLMGSGLRNQAPDLPPKFGKLSFQSNYVRLQRIWPFCVTTDCQTFLSLIPRYSYVVDSTSKSCYTVALPWLH